MWANRFILMLLLAAGVALIFVPAVAQSVDEINDLQKKIQQLNKFGKYGDALTVQRTLAQNIEKAETQSTGTAGPKTASALGNVAWQALLARKFDVALAAAERAHSLAPDLLWVEINRAHALLFLGRLEEARAIYLSHKGQQIPENDDKTWEEVIAEDFEALRKVDLDRPALGDIAAELESELTTLSKKVKRLTFDGKYSEAMPLAERYVALARQRVGENHLEYATAITLLALLYDVKGRYAEAEPLSRHALAVFEKALGPDHPDVSAPLRALAIALRATNRKSEAEQLMERVAVIEAKQNDDPGPLAETYFNQGRYSEAEPLYKRSLAIREKALGPDHLDVAKLLNGLALIYEKDGRYAEAELLFKRCLDIREKALGSNHLDVAVALGNLASVFADQGRYAEARALHLRSLSIREKALGPNHADVANALNSLATLHYEQGHYAEAVQLSKRSLAITEKALGPDHPNVALVLNNLAQLYYAQGRDAEALQLHQQSLAIYEKALGPDDPSLVLSLSNLAQIYFKQEDWARAAHFWRRSTAILVRRTQLGADDIGRALRGKRKDEAERMSWQFSDLVKAAYRLARQGHEVDTALAREMFETAQWVQASEAAGSLAQMAVRGAKGDRALAALVRERQDLASEWQNLDSVRIVGVAQAPNKRDLAVEAANAARLAAIDTRIAEIDQRLKVDFPDYVSFARPEPLSVAEAQAELRSDEALVLFLDTLEWRATPDETFIWVVTKTDMRWVRSEVGTRALTREVAALRCGLDATAWYGESAARCADTLGIGLDKAPKENDALPFDHARSYKLYQALFGEIAELIKGKHLLLVPSGPLTQLPFQVLTSAEPTSGGNKSAAWLVRSHALTVLPSASSLRMLRRVAKPSTATKTLIGFGNPLLEGLQDDSRRGEFDRKLAAAARNKQSCRESVWSRVAATFRLHAGIDHVAARGRLANLPYLRMQTPLPETADELCAVAHDLEVDPNEIRLGARATEREIKGLSKSGALAAYHIVYFATHGVLAGQIDRTSEPGLILTPPETASEEDDGYLSASEIAALKLDADWVILSACNTAAGRANGAEALSGIARAFFYANARALLVSYWEVYSDAAVALMTSAISAISSDPKIGRAEALRRAMLALIDNGKPEEAQPAYWAPFVLVGDGGALVVADESRR